MSAFQDMIASLHSRFHYLQFDPASLQDLSSCRQIYGISSHEELIFYLYGQGPIRDLARDGIIMTDRAIYLHPSTSSISGRNFILLSDICGFLFYQETLQDSVRAIGRKEEFVLYKSFAGHKNDAGRELVELLRIFQKNLMNINTRLQLNYREAVACGLSLVRVGFSENGVLTRRQEYLLNIIDIEGDFPLDVAYIRAENYYRICDMTAYFTYLSSVQGKLNPDLYLRLQKPEEIFFEDYISDISNPFTLSVTQELILPYSNLKKQKSFSLQEAIIFSYLCVRMDDSITLSYLLNRYSSEFGEKRLWEIKSFEAKLRNERMARIYNQILSSKSIPASEASWEDSYGFSALHYALMLRNWESVKEVLAIRDWSEYSNPYAEDKELGSLFDFTFLASDLYQNPEAIRTVFTATSKLAKPILKSIKQLENMIYINRELSRFDLVTEYEKTRDELNHELDDMVNRLSRRYRSEADKIRFSGSPYARFILSVYERQDSLFTILTSTMADWRIYRFNQRFFLTTFDVDLPFSYYEWMNQVFTSRNVSPSDGQYRWSQEEEEAFYRRNPKKESQEKSYHHYSFDGASDSMEDDFDGHFFSPEARKDLLVLKKEYRALVKKYHPDNMTGVDTTVIMQRIMTERADIIANL